MPGAAAPDPKCNHVAARTMEIFRRLEIAEKVRGAGLPADYPHDIAYRTTSHRAGELDAHPDSRMAAIASMQKTSFDRIWPHA